MHGRTSTAAVPRTKSLRADRMSTKRRRQEMANLIANGIARAVAARAEQAVEGSEKSEDSASPHGRYVRSKRVQRRRA